MTPEDMELNKTIAMGVIAEDFVNTDLGREVIRRAESLRESALALLSKCDPEDPRNIRKLQNDIALAERFQTWLAEIVMEGRNAIAEVQAREANN